jgi:hypothetical protein
VSKKYVYDTTKHFLHSIIIHVLTSIASIFSQYCDKMAKEYEYGDESMLRAFAFRYRRRVQVYQISRNGNVSEVALITRVSESRPRPLRREDPLVTIVRNPVVDHYNFIHPE